MARLLSILLIEESQNNAAELLSPLKQAGYELTSRRVTSADEAQVALLEVEWEIVLLSDSLPDFDVAQALAMLNSTRPDLPIIVICAVYAEDQAAALISTGASDCLPRGQTARLLPILERELARVRGGKQNNQAVAEKRESEGRYRVLFEYSPISLWEEDFSAVKKSLASLAAAGVSDFRAYFNSHPDELLEMAGLVKILDVNRATLDLYQAATKELLLKSLEQIFRPDSVKSFIDELVYIAQGRCYFEWEGVNQTITGVQLFVAVSWAAVSGHEDDLSRVLVSVIDITRRKHDEQQLRLAEARLRGLVEQVPGIVYTESPSTSSDLFYISPQIEALTGFPALDWVSIPGFWRAHIHPLDFPAFDLVDQHSNRTGEKFRAEYRLMKADGLAVWVHDEAVLVCDEQGKPLFWQGMMTDISDRKQVEQALVNSQTRFRSYFDLPLIGIAVSSPEKGWIEVNDRLCSILEYSRQELAAMTWVELTHPDDIERNNEEFQRVISGELEGYSLDKRFITRSGRIIWTTMAVGCVRTPEGGVDYFVTIIEDISARKQAEQETRRRLEELEALYQNSLIINRLLKPEEIARAVIATFETRLQWHHAAIRLYNPQTMRVELVTLSQPTSEHGEQRARTARLSKNITSSGKGMSAWVYQNGQVVRSPDVKNDSRYFETFPGIRSGLYVPLRSGEATIGTISVESEQTDAFTEQDERLLVTIAAQAAISIENAQLYLQVKSELAARIQAETDLLQAHARLEGRVVERTAELRAANLELEKAARMKDEFLASMSHELRTPLTGILGLSEVLQLESYGPLTEKQRTAMGHIHNSGRHLMELINNILDFSKIEAGKFDLSLAPCSLGEICKASLHMVASQTAAKHLQASFDITPNIILLNADARRLKQIIINLLSNAIKFTPDGGRYGIQIAGDQAQQQVSITVWDSGIGIKDEDKQRLFQTFVQLDARLSRQYAGTGLGLMLVRRLAELQGGSVTLESDFGQGSRFTVTLPWHPVE